MAKSNKSLSILISLTLLILCAGFYIDVTVDLNSDSQLAATVNNVIQYALNELNLTSTYTYYPSSI